MTATMPEPRNPLLPPGIKIGSGIGENEEPVVMLEFDVKLPGGGKIAATLVFPPRQMRALCALGLKQADIAEGRGGPAWRPGLVGGRDG